MVIIPYNSRTMPNRLCKLANEARRKPNEARRKSVRVYGTTIPL